MSVLHGECWCGRVQYEVSGALGPVVNCHCGFCRRVHGAAFTTVALASPGSIAWSPSSAAPAVFETPLGNRRHFCGACASPLWNLSTSIELAAIVVGSLAPESQPEPWAHVNTESKAPWLEICDPLPRFRGWPSPGELRQLCSQHPAAWAPAALLAPPESRP